MPFLFLGTKPRARDVAPLVECLLSTHEDMGSFLTLHKTGRGDLSQQKFKSPSATEQVQGQPGIDKTLSQR